MWGDGGCFVDVCYLVVMRVFGLLVVLVVFLWLLVRKLGSVILFLF